MFHAPSAGDHVQILKRAATHLRSTESGTFPLGIAAATIGVVHATRCAPRRRLTAGTGERTV
jgi:hypothetical protein